jgi:hypothetical protein
MAKKNICKPAFGETSHATASEAFFQDLRGGAMDDDPMFLESQQPTAYTPAPR